MSANGCLVIENTPRTEIAKPDLIMALVRATPKKMMVTSLDTIERKKSQFKQAHHHLDSQVKKGHYISVRPKFGFGIGNRNQGPISVSVSEPKFFFPKPKLFFSNFTLFFLLLGGIQVFISLEINLALQKQFKSI